MVACIEMAVAMRAKGGSNFLLQRSAGHPEIHLEASSFQLSLEQ